jgi:hypothetical protein
MEVPAHADLLQLELAGTKLFRGSSHTVVDRLIEVFKEVSVETDFRSEELRIENRVVPVGRRRDRRDIRSADFPN